jgi:hypothetical protein
MFGFSGFISTGDADTLYRELYYRCRLALIKQEDIFSSFMPDSDDLPGAYREKLSLQKYVKEEIITPMEALDQVKVIYAANFEKVYTKNTDEYYYKLPFADYYLAYEGPVQGEEQYLFHLYEFVLDEPETGIGHTVTYGWYTVDKETGEITDNTDYE